MQTVETMVVPASPSVVFGFVSELDAYPAWLRLVHAADRASTGDEPAWDVELRARVGPFARSKRIRMRRTVLDPDRCAAFERAEVDGREHAMWALRAELEPVDDGTLLAMHLRYDGSLWSAPVLGRVLADEVERARGALVALVAGR